MSYEPQAPQDDPRPATPPAAGPDFSHEPQPQPQPQRSAPEVTPTPTYPSPPPYQPQPGYGPTPYGAAGQQGFHPPYTAPGYGQYGQPGPYGQSPYGQPQYPAYPMAPYSAYAAEDPTNPDRPRPGVGPLTAFQLFWQRGFQFYGRSSRSEFWWAMLANTVALFGPVLLFANTSLENVGMSIWGLYLLAAFIPNLALVVRRLHDTNNSGFLALLAAIPFFGWLIIMVFSLLPSNPLGIQYDRTRPWQ